MVKRIVCFGPGPRFKGGIAHYNTSLARSLVQFGQCEVHIVSWSRQYPFFIPREFRDTQSKEDPLKSISIQVHYLTDFNNPLSWHRTYRFIKALDPDMVIFQWAITIQGLPLRYIAGKLMKHTCTRVIFDLHNIVQKENSLADRYFTRRGISRAHGYIVHGDLTLRELQSFLPDVPFEEADPGFSVAPGKVPVLKLFHPVYDMFTPDESLNTTKLKAELGLRRHVFLFFGFIRKYKGLHHVIEAFSKVAAERDDVSLLIAGESFWNTLDQRSLQTRIKQAIFGLAKSIFLRRQDDEREYRPLDMIGELGIDHLVYQHIGFVPNEDVHLYFQVSDYLLLFYTYATPSGVESIAYNFNLPVIATRVGNFPDTVQDGINGYLAEPGDVNSMAEAMLRAIENPIPRENVGQTAAQMSWERYVKTILGSVDVG